MGAMAGGRHPLSGGGRLCMSAFVLITRPRRRPVRTERHTISAFTDHTVCTITQFTNSSRSAFRDVIRYKRHASHKGIRIMSHVIQFKHPYVIRMPITNYTIKMTLRYFGTLLRIYTQRPRRPVSREVFTSSLTPAGPW